VYCYIANENNSDCHEAYAEDNLQQIITLLNEMEQKYRQVHIIFYGGEPLLEFELIKKLVSYCDEKIMYENSFITYGIVTNGTLLTSKIVDFFIDKTFSISISIDGSHQTMKKNRSISDMTYIEKMLKKMNDAQLSTKIIATLQNQTVDKLHADIEYLFNLPCKLISFVPCDSPCATQTMGEETARNFCALLKSKISQFLKTKDYKSLKRIQELISAIKKIDHGKKKMGFCGYGKDVFAISCEGKLYPCPSFLGKKTYEVIDNKILFPKKIKHLECQNCIAQAICQKSCHYSQYVASKSEHNSMQGRCIFNREMTRIALDIYAELYL